MRRGCATSRRTSRPTPCGPKAGWSSSCSTGRSGLRTRCWRSASPPRPSTPWGRTIWPPSSSRAASGTPARRRTSRPIGPGSWRRSIGHGPWRSTTRRGDPATIRATSNWVMIDDPEGYLSGDCLCRACVPETIARVADAVRDVRGRRKTLIFIGTYFRAEESLQGPASRQGGAPGFLRSPEIAPGSSGRLLGAAGGRAGEDGAGRRRWPTSPFRRSTRSGSKPKATVRSADRWPDRWSGGTVWRCPPT